MFQLSGQEIEIMVSKNAIPSKKQLGGTLPYVFTVHDVPILAIIIKKRTSHTGQYKSDRIFCEAQDNAGYNILDLGADRSGKESTFYNMEKITVYGSK